MTQQIETGSESFDPDGSIFLPEITSEDDIRRHRFALLMNRPMDGYDYRNMDSVDKEQVMHWLQEHYDRLLGAQALKA